MGGRYTAVTLPFTTFSFVDDDRAIEFTPGWVDAGAAAGCGTEDYVALHARFIHVQGIPTSGTRRPRWRRTERAGPRTVRHQRRGAAEVARRQTRSVRSKLQHRRPPVGVPRPELSDDRRIRRRAITIPSRWYGRPTHALAVYKVASRLPPLHPLRRVLTGGSAAARRTRRCSMRSRRRARRRAAGHRSTCGQNVAVVDNALFPNAYDMSRLSWRKNSPAVTFEYNQRGHQVYRVIEIDAATASARRDRRGREDLLLLLGQEIPSRHRRRQGSHLDVGARRLESPLPLRRRDRAGEEPDHQRRVAGPRLVQVDEADAPDLVQRERDVSGQGSRTSSTSIGSTSTARA